jgi:hypothetical protein
MLRHKLFLPLIVLLMSFGIYLSLASVTPTIHAQRNGEIITYGKTVQGDVENRFGDEWIFFGWEGERITITLSSSEFDTYLELYGPEYRRWYRRNNNFEGMGTNSALNNYKLPASGYYTIVVAPDDSDATGTYTLSLTTVATTTLSQGNEITATVTQVEEVPTPPSGEPTCEIASSYLNLRAGPGIDYSPPLHTFPRATRFWPTSRNEDGSWIEVIMTGALERGWLRASGNFIDCTIDINTLPVSDVPSSPEDQE